jgi:hypothetical protein
MANPLVKIEIGSDSNVPGNWFTLDSATKGLLNGSYGLADGYYLDVTSYATNFKVSRGKSRELDRYGAGHATVEFTNTNRYFDPTYTSSPFYGQIVPRRNLRITVKNIVTFTGIIDDWDLSFSTDGTATAVCNADDNFALLSQQSLTADTYPEEFSGARVNRVLNSAGVVYNTAARLIDDGQMILASATVDNTFGALDHLQNVELSESGGFFIDKFGNVVFQDSTNIIPAATGAVFADDGTGIGYQGMQIVYGSELLYNSASVAPASGTTQLVSDLASSQTYGIRNIDQKTLLSTDAQAFRLASWLVQQYKQPELRFESIDVSLGDISTANQLNVLAIELGDKCQIIYKPSKIPPAITKYAQVIGIDHASDPNQHIVTLRFKTLDYSLLILDDVTYGLLDSYYLGL